MAVYRIAGQEIYFSCPVSDLNSYEIPDTESSVTMPLPTSPSTLITKTVGWVGGKQRRVVVQSAFPGTLLKVAGGGVFYIAPAGTGIVHVDTTIPNWQADSTEVFGLDREILLGPALVLALASRGTWSLHASAVKLDGSVTVFLGESGLGKSTLAAHLSREEEARWIRVADDILPVAASSSGVEARPHFPQLKLSMESQPGPVLLEQLPIGRFYLLANTDAEQPPALRLLPRRAAMQVLISNTAGTRLFNPGLLQAHLSFCAKAAQLVPVYELSYPRRWDMLAKVRELLETS